jgi:hypothetical protein
MGITNFLPDVFLAPAWIRYHGKLHKTKTIREMILLAYLVLFFLITPSVILFMPKGFSLENIWHILFYSGFIFSYIVMACRVLLVVIFERVD